ARACAPLRAPHAGAGRHGARALLLARPALGAGAGRAARAVVVVHVTPFVVMPDLLALFVVVRVRELEIGRVVVLARGDPVEQVRLPRLEAGRRPGLVLLVPAPT